MERSLAIPTTLSSPLRLSRSRPFLVVSLAILLLGVVEKGLSTWCYSDYGAGICGGFSLPLNFFLDLAFITLVVLVFDGTSDRLMLSALATSLVYHAGQVMGGWFAPAPDLIGLNFVGSSLPVFLGQTVLLAVMRILIPAAILRLLTRGNWRHINALNAFKFGLSLVLLSAGMIAILFALAALATPGAAATGFVLTRENVAGGLLSVLAVWLAAMLGKRLRERE
jgi:hypothetical protein